jgi:hypothetical protein
MSARDTARVAHRKLTAPDAFGRRLGNNAVAHLGALRERERERRDQIAIRCRGGRTR